NDGGLILLDGLDEVPAAGERRVQLKEVVEDFVKAHPKCRFLVTSRTYAYQKQDWKLAGFAEATLAPFDDDQIARFSDRFSTHMAAVQGRSIDDSRADAAIPKHAIATRRELRELAERPLLLTLMASVNAGRRGGLPEKREELYAQAVELL